jgi:hypothetical protein
MLQFFDDLSLAHACVHSLLSGAAVNPQPRRFTTISLAAGSTAARQLKISKSTTTVQGVAKMASPPSLSTLRRQLFQGSSNEKKASECSLTTTHNLSCSQQLKKEAPSVLHSACQDSPVMDAAHMAEQARAQTVRTPSPPSSNCSEPASPRPASFIKCTHARLMALRPSTAQPEQTSVATGAAVVAAQDNNDDDDDMWLTCGEGCLPHAPDRRPARSALRSWTVGSLSFDP